MQAALVQLNSGPQIAANLDRIAGFVAQAAEGGARLVCLPENSARVVGDGRGPHFSAEDHPAIPAFAEMARAHGVTLAAGSIAVLGPDGRLFNRALVFAPTGALIAQYDKIHLFDVDLPNGERYRESERIAPGERAVLVEAEGAKIGLSICYDLRFAALFRRLAQAGAEIILLPSAFTVPTGEAHWHTLIRARAIETGCYLLAPAQTGEHDMGRRTYGHALAVDPWGRVLADAGTEPGVTRVDLDLSKVAEARRAIPQLRHDRDFVGP